MNVSALFIRRPVATFLLAVAVLLGGVLGYSFLPVSALPQVDFPDDPGHDAAAWRQSRHDGRARHRAAGAPARADPVPELDDLVLVLRPQRGDAAVLARPRHRRRRAGCPGCDQRRRVDAAEEPAVPAGLFQGEPGRHRRDRAGANLEDAHDPRDVGPRRHVDRPAPLGGQRRRSRRHPSAGSSRRCACRPICPDWRTTASAWRTCATRSPTPTSMAPRARSTAPSRPTRSAPTTSSAPPPPTARWSSPTATPRRC